MLKICYIIIKANLTSARGCWVIFEIFISHLLKLMLVYYAYKLARRQINILDAQDSEYSKNKSPGGAS